MTRIRIGSVVVAVATALLVGSGGADATPPGQNGRIAYRVYFNEAHTAGAIFTMEPDGSDIVQVTHPKPGVLHTEPDWSADGQWITFTRVPRGGLLTGYPTPVGRENHVIIIRPDGTDRTDLTKVTCVREDGCLGDRTSAWSPDSEWIAFVRKSNDVTERGYVALMRPDGTDPHQLTSPAPHFSDNTPMWSPDGTQIVFNRFQRRTDHDGVFTMTASGTDLQRITPYEMNCTNGPDWSPDGVWFVFRCGNFADVHLNLWLVHPDGTELHRFTRNRHHNLDWGSTTFSPDGTMIVTSRLQGDGKADNYVMNIEGNDLEHVSHRDDWMNVTNSRTWESAVDWGPSPT
jgi:Tol biopolymer transport system component